eukprot:TRINITY_DN7657_c0_g1_i3.p1 TRINITY_DN7657_c0_g1~~TRINITY_DN7657_c0_g1_i3.p1  ORF type:complete len:625 (+),score=63.33 TRINITY_DN7657_c0_g1_i3:106-1980(+)
MARPVLHSLVSAASASGAAQQQQETAPRISGAARAFRNFGLHAEFGCGVSALPANPCEAKRRVRGKRKGAPNPCRISTSPSGTSTDNVCESSHDSGNEGPHQVPFLCTSGMQPVAAPTSPDTVRSPEFYRLNDCADVGVQTGCSWPSGVSNGQASLLEALRKDVTEIKEFLQACAFFPCMVDESGHGTVDCGARSFFSGSEGEHSASSYEKGKFSSADQRARSADVDVHCTGNSAGGLPVVGTIVGDKPITADAVTDELHAHDARSTVSVDAVHCNLDNPGTEAQATSVLAPTNVADTDQSSQLHVLPHPGISAGLHDYFYRQKSDNRCGSKRSDDDCRFRPVADFPLPPHEPVFRLTDVADFSKSLALPCLSQEPLVKEAMLGSMPSNVDLGSLGFPVLREGPSPGPPFPNKGAASPALELDSFCSQSKVSDPSKPLDTFDASSHKEACEAPESKQACKLGPVHPEYIDSRDDCVWEHRVADHGGVDKQLVTGVGSCYAQPIGANTAGIDPAGVTLCQSHPIVAATCTDLDSSIEHLCISNLSCDSQHVSYHAGDSGTRRDVKTFHHTSSDPKSNKPVCLVEPCQAPCEPPLRDEDRNCSDHEGLLQAASSDSRDNPLACTLM